MQISGLGVLSDVTDKDVSEAGVFVVPESVFYLSEDVFANSNNLKTIILKDTLLSLNSNALNKIRTIIADTKTEKSYYRLKSALSAQAKTRILDKKIGDFVLETQQRNLVFLNQQPEINPISTVCSVRPEGFSKLSPYDLQKITAFLSDNNPKYLKAKFEIEMIPLPRTEEGCRLYEKKCQAVVDECLKQFRSTKQKTSSHNKSHFLETSSSFFRPFFYPLVGTEYKNMGIIETRRNVSKHFEFYKRTIPHNTEVKMAISFDILPYLKLYFDMYQYLNFHGEHPAINLVMALFFFYAFMLNVMDRVENEIICDELTDIMLDAELTLSSKLSIEFTEEDKQKVNQAGLGDLTKFDCM